MSPKRTPEEIDSEQVLTLLEDDQLVAAKERTHLGRRGFSRGLSLVLWALRAYVVLMLVLIVINVVETVGARH